MSSRYCSLPMLTVVAVLAVGAWLLTWTVPVAPQHGRWHDRYTGAGGVRCCDKDCVPVQARLVQQTAQEARVEVNGVAHVLPSAAVHLSEDTQAWACFTAAGGVRCVFLAVGG